MSPNLVGKTGDYINNVPICASERSERAPRSQEQYIFMKSPKVSMDCCCLLGLYVAIIVYITLIIFDRIECFYSLIN